MTTAILITADQFSDMSFDMPVELVRGEIVEMTLPGGRHGAVCFNTAGVIRDWIRDRIDFVAMTNDPGVVTERNPDTVRGPDLLVVHRDRLPNGEIPKKHFLVSPNVAIEVKSPTDRWPEIVTKIGEFLRAGTEEAWVIDPEHRRIHIFRRDDEPTILNVTETLVTPILPGFSASVSEFFEGI